MTDLELFRKHCLPFKVDWEEEPGLEKMAPFNVFSLASQCFQMAPVWWFSLKPTLCHPIGFAPPGASHGCSVLPCPEQAHECATRVGILNVLKCSSFWVYVSLL